MKNAVVVLRLRGTMPPFVKIRWHDAEDVTVTWVRSEDVADHVKEPCEVVSWGYLVAKTRRDYVLAGDYIPRDDTYGRVTKIPRGMVIKIETIEKAAK